MKLKSLVLVASLLLIACDVRIDSPTEPSKDKGVVVITPTPTLNQIVINSFTGDNTAVLANATVILRWSVSGPAGTSCRIEPLVGDVPTTGFVSLSLLNTTTFVLSCSISGLTPVNRILIITVVK
jgi:hypothetical protein